MELGINTFGDAVLILKPEKQYPMQNACRNSCAK